MAEEVGAPRRWRLLDAILLIAATAAAMLPAKDRWPEVMPVARKLEATRLLDDTYWKELFRRQMRSGRIDSVRVQFEQIIAPALGLGKSIEIGTTRLTATSHDLAIWAWVHASPGALGFALAQDGYFLVFPFLFLWSACFLVLRLIRPRPAWSDLFRQPGWWVCFSSVLGSVMGIAVESLLGHPVPSVVVPVIVVVAWIVLVGCGKVQAEPSWIDRAGRVLGVLWFGMIPVYLVGFVFSRV